MSFASSEAVRRGVFATIIWSLGCCVDSEGKGPDSVPTAAEENAAERGFSGRSVEMSPWKKQEYEVVAIFPHDSQAFTQGLAYVAGDLIESTGLRGKSELRRVDLETGAVVEVLALNENLFGEGITVVGSHIYQLTWQSGRGFIYDLDTFQRIGFFENPREGWGMATDGTVLILSDGTSTLRFLSPSSFEVLRSLEVHDDGKPVDGLNELEFVEGEILANLWGAGSGKVVRISPVSGNILGWLDVSNLLSEEQKRSADVPNGIAFDQDGGRLFLTGKWWPKLFQIRLADSSLP